MGPFENIGPYAETTIATRKTDHRAASDNSPGFCDVLISLLLLPITLLVISFFGLFILKYIGLIIVIGLVYLGLWGCARHGQGNKLFKWHWKRGPSMADRATIKRRLSGKKKLGIEA